MRGVRLVCGGWFHFVCVCVCGGARAERGKCDGRNVTINTKVKWLENISQDFVWPTRKQARAACAFLLRAAAVVVVVVLWLVHRERYQGEEPRRQVSVCVCEEICILALWGFCCASVRAAYTRAL